MNTLDERIRGDHPIFTGRGSQYGPIVTNSDDDPARTARSSSRARATRSALDALNQTKLAKIPKLHEPQRSWQLQK
jgi:hypothetical protein